MVDPPIPAAGSASSCPWLCWTASWASHRETLHFPPPTDGKSGAGSGAQGSGGALPLGVAFSPFGGCLLSCNDTPIVPSLVGIFHAHSGLMAMPSPLPHLPHNANLTPPPPDTRDQFDCPWRRVVHELQERLRPLRARPRPHHRRQHRL